MKFLTRCRELPWKKATRNFFQRELISILFWSSLGAITAGAVRLLASDNAFDAFLISNYLPSAKRFDEPARYVPYLLTGAVALILILIIRLPHLIKRALKSWLLGVTSGMKIISFTVALLALGLYGYSIWYRLLAALAVVSLALVNAYTLGCLAIYRQSRIPSENDIRVPLGQKSKERTAVSDEAINSWLEDALGRESLVDALTTKILISHAPIVALFGPFGSGKTSTFKSSP